VVLFLYGIAAGGANSAQMLFGGVAGLVVGASMGRLVYFGLLGVPIRHFFTVTSAMILLLAACRPQKLHQALIATSEYS
jgi:high-affinity iron transporter